MVGLGGGEGHDAKAEACFRQAKSHLESMLPRLPKHKLEELRTLIVRHYMKRGYGRRRTPKYGSINKGFTEQQLQAFMAIIDSPKFKLLFKFQAYLGLRIGEAVGIGLKSINFQMRELTIKTEKKGTFDTMIIPLQLFKETTEYIRAYAAQIEQAQGCLFYKDVGRGGGKQRSQGFVDSSYARNKFREYVTRANLDEAYDLSDEREGRRVRKLHRLSTHSLRHYAITHFSKQTNGNIVLTSRFARHSDIDMTMTYVHTQKEELYREIDNAFSLEGIEELKKRVGK